MKFRTNCPIARTLDVLGDKWTLLVLRDLIVFKKTTFKELSEMPEKIATNTLSERLERLVKHGFITKTQSSKSKLVFLYSPTQKAIDLIPMMLQIKEWSEKYLFKVGERPARVE
jgi:DNA-binding HxlR family transcriptional regulator